LFLIILINLKKKTLISHFPAHFPWHNQILESVFQLGVFVSRKVIFGKPLSKLSCVCLLLEKLVNRKYFPVNGKYFSVKEKFSFVSRKVFSFYFLRKTLSGSCEKFRNAILFADYIKFGPQTFDCYIYIYILFWILFFQFHPLKFNLYIFLISFSFNFLIC
jgi:hypothetical protein